MTAEKSRAIRALTVAALLAVMTTTGGWCQVMKEPSDDLAAGVALVAEPTTAGKCAAPQPREQTRSGDAVDEAAATEQTPPSWLDLLRSMAEALRERLVTATRG